MKKSLSDLPIGAVIKVKPGTKDPDTGGDLGGWQGRVTDFGEDEEGQATVGIAWDSLTLKNMPRAALEHSIKEGLDWQCMYLYPAELELATARDTERDVERAIDELDSQTAWLHLDEEGVRIQAVLNGIDPDDQLAQVAAWEAYLEKNLKFPFAAEVAELLERGRLRVGDQVKVLGISEADDHYGVLVNVSGGKGHFVFPLCDLEATDKRSANYQPLRDYVVWFANR